MTVSTVASPTTNVCTFWTPQWKIFRVHNRFWVFYSDGTNIYFKSSLDGITWSGATLVRAGASRDFACYCRGNYVHYVWAGGVLSDFNYRRGLLNTDGSITWSAVEQNVTSPTVAVHDPCITVDTTGHAYVSYHNAGTTLECVRNSNTDGTWSTTWTHTQAGLSFGSAGRTRVIWSSSGVLWLCFVEANAMQLGWDRWNGSSWAGLSWGPAPTYGNRWSVAEYRPTGVFYFAYVVGTDLRLYNMSAATGETGLATVYTQSHASIICMTDRLRLVYDSAAATISYRDKIGGTSWQAAVNISASETALARGSLTTYERSYDGYSAAVWQRGSGSPYDIRHEFWAPSSGTATLHAEFEIAGPSGSEDLLAEFTVRPIESVALHAEFVVRHPGSQDLIAEFSLGLTYSVELKTSFIVRQSSSNDLKAVFSIPLSASADLPASFEVGQDAHDLFSRLYLMQGVDIVGPVNVTVSDYDAAIRYPVQKLSFFTAGRHWLFYAHAGVMRYRTSFNGSSWSAAISIGPITVSGNMAVHFDGTYIHVSRTENNILYYRRGTPNIDGSISWSAAEQAVYDNSAVGSLLHASIAVLTGGRPAISYLRSDGINYRPRVKISDNSDGTWSGSEAEFTLNNSTDTSWGSVLLTLGSELYVLYGRDNSTIKARRYNGSWQLEEDTGYDTRIGVTWSATLRAGEIHIAYVDDTDRDIYHGYRSIGGIWQARSSVQIGLFTNNGVQIVSSGGAIYIFWLNPTIKEIDYRKSLDDGATWLDEAGNDAPQKFLDSPAAFTFFYDLQVYDVKTGGHIGMMWLTGAGSPYTIYFADIGPLTLTGLEVLSEFVARHTSTKDLSATFHVGQDSRDLEGEFTVRHSSSGLLKAIFEVRHYSSTELKASFISRQSAAQSLKAFLIIQQLASEDLLALSTIRHAAIAGLKASFIPRRSAASDLLAIAEVAHWEYLRAEFVVRHPDAEELPATFHVGQDSLDLRAIFRLRQGAEDLHAEFFVWPVTDLPAEFVVRHSTFVRRRIYAKFVVRHTAPPIEILATLIVARPSSQDLLAIFSTSTVTAIPSNLLARFYVRPRYLKGDDSRIDHGKATEIKGGGEAGIRGRGQTRIRDEESSSSIRSLGRAKIRD